MRLYANAPGRRAVQIVVDLIVVVGAVTLIWLGALIGSAVRDLATAGRQIESGGSTFNEQMAQLAQKAGDIPLVGDSLQQPFSAAAGAGGSLRDAGETFATSVDRIGWLITVAVIVATVCVATLLWIGLRLPWIRRAGHAGRQLRLPGGEVLLAWEALHRSKPAVLLAIHPDPVGAVRAADPVVTNALAHLRLTQLGLHPARARLHLPG